MDKSRQTYFMKIFTQAENQEWSQTLPGKMCSACLVLKSTNKVLMVKATYKDHWTFPSGIVDDKESPLSAAIRETAEEVGIVVNSDDCRLLKVVYTASKNGDRDRFNFAFITDVTNMDILLSVPNEEIASAKWVSLDEVATLSNNKGSYIEFQKLLLDETIISPYTEI